MIIGLMGKSRSGKGTAGAVLARELNGVCIALADPMKRFIHHNFKLTIDQLWGESKEKPISKQQLKFIAKDQWMAVSWVKRLNECLPKQYVPHNPSTEGAMRSWWDSIKDEKKLSPRKVLQTFGTQLGRQVFGEDIWIRAALETASQVLRAQDYSRELGLIRGGPRNAVVIDDVRFRNEALALKMRGAKVFKVHRSGLKANSALDTKHASEAEQDSIPSFWLDGLFENPEGSKEVFEEMVANYAQRLTYLRTVV